MSTAHTRKLWAIDDEHQRFNRLVELNVQEQCINVIKTAVVQLNFLTKGYPEVHGWVFDIHNGNIIDLKIDFQKILNEIKEIYDLTR